MKKLITLTLLFIATTLYGESLITPEQATKLQKLLAEKPEWMDDSTVLVLAGNSNLSCVHSERLFYTDKLLPIPVGNIIPEETTLKIIDQSWSKSKITGTPERKVRYRIFFICLICGIFGGIACFKYGKTEDWGDINRFIIYPAFSGFVSIIVLGFIFAYITKKMTTGSWVHADNWIMIYIFIQPMTVSIITAIFRTWLFNRNAKRKFLKANA